MQPLGANVGVAVARVKLRLGSASMNTYLRIDRCVDMCMAICMDMSIDMCMDMRMDMWRATC